MAKSPDQKKCAQKQCALSKQLHDPHEMLRLVHHAEFGWGIDPKGNLPSEGWWILPKLSLINDHGNNVLDANPKDIVSLIDRYLVQQVQQTLSRSRRAGAFCIGGDRITQWFRDHPNYGGTYLLKAHNGGSQKLWRYLYGVGQTWDNANLSQAELAEPFDRAALGSVLILNSGFCRILRQDCDKLHLLRAE